MTSDGVEVQARQLAARAYTRLVTPDIEEGGFVVRFLEFPGIAAECDSLEEAWSEATEAVTASIEVSIEGGRPVPEPLAARNFSGRLQLRIPPSLHERVTELALLENVSLNRWLSQTVADVVARKTERMPARVWPVGDGTVIPFPIRANEAIGEAAEAPIIPQAP